MHLPEPKNLPYKTLLADIEKGLIKIPQFQRDYVWSKERAAGLIDSILKGYPIGTFITWKTKETLRVVKDLGGVVLPPVPEGDFAEYVLDGQQRMTSLFCALKGVQIKRGKKTDDFAEIFVDLNASEHDQIVVIDTADLEQGTYISLTNLINAGLTVLASFDAKYHAKLEEYKQTLQGYNFSLIEVKEAPLDVATEIFTRINVGGKPLSLFEIMVAKTFDATEEFDLSEKFEALVNRLREVGYDTISDATVLQIIALVIGKECKRQNILRLDKKRFIEEWPKVASAIESAVDYFRGYYRIPVSKLLPYNSLLAPFAYFFYHHNDKPLNNKQICLEDFFWRVSLGGRYSSSVEGKLAQDIKRIDQILGDSKPSYDWAIDTSAQFIKDNGWFNAGRSYIKAILCIMAYQQPKSFIDGSIVHISNDWLKQANSRNYHHYFPRAFLRKQGLGDEHSNHIGNITIVDDFLNKRKIGAQSPFVYMSQFADQNCDLETHMKTHLIELNEWGIWEDNYDAFLTKRCEKLSEEIKKRLVLREQDRNSHQSINIEDIDELALEADL
ncbi:GmrSD restriction endonuclease domain-containing protein [Brumicola nitratireducens]|uniref:GmrSD restriction endonucleases N-terminal domain-containing protein n=1 Tax=Glaciecola nitratireducens (strain JCM 12485 / KCTC 12276 / FR1064) TaxID=1085623 RepID=G4QL03_GLANF|nr:DUF262 domain-containing protein [Glaciecola nitratireducens]AEP29393.1 hypothetical protein GNIT_1269 [Glaciecola nitratireducens FR1064]